MKRLKIQKLDTSTLGYHNPGQYPPLTEELGAPLGVQQVADLIGCSVWSVRHRHIPAGLPYFRTGPSGRLIFYRNQVVRWILKNQRGEVA